jgi:hypothetical protein
LHDATKNLQASTDQATFKGTVSFGAQGGIGGDPALALKHFWFRGITSSASPSWHPTNPMDRFGPDPRMPVAYMGLS